MAATVSFFHELRRLTGKLSSDIGQLKANVQAPPQAVTKVQAAEAIAPLYGRLDAVEQDILQCKENHMGTEVQHIATTAQVVAAATEVLASQLTVYKALEEYMLPFGFKRPKHAMQTQVVVTSPPKVPETSEADDEAENDENDENAVVESPVEAVATAAPAIPSVAPSPFRQPILDAEDAPTPTLEAIGLSAFAQQALLKVGAPVVAKAVSKPAATAKGRAQPGKPRSSHQSHSSTEATPPIPAGLLTTAVTPAASRAELDREELFACPATPASPTMPQDLLGKFASPVAKASSAKKRRLSSVKAAASPYTTRSASKRSTTKAPKTDGQTVAPITESEWLASSDRSKAGVSVDAVNAAIEKMNEWIAEQAAFGLTSCDVITTVDLEDEVGIDEGSIIAFTALLIAFKRITSLGRGRFQIL